jgi:hypothetical protein
VRDCGGYCRDCLHGESRCFLVETDIPFTVQTLTVFSPNASQTRYSWGMLRRSSTKWLFISSDSHFLLNSCRFKTFSNTCVPRVRSPDKFLQGFTRLSATLWVLVTLSKNSRFPFRIRKMFLFCPWDLGSRRILKLSYQSVGLESSIVIFSVLANNLNNTTTIKWDMCITL